MLVHFFDTAVLLCWMILATFAFKGWGGLILDWITRSLYINKNLPGIKLYEVWIGICACITLTEIFHFIAPINWKISLLILGSGIVIDISRYQTRYYELFFLNQFKPLIRRNANNKLILLFLVFFIWTGIAMRTPDNFDSGFYHFGTIKWLNESPVVLGLVNLHSRFAFNQSYFALVALLNIYPVYPGSYAGTGLYLLILTAISVVHLIALDMQKRTLFIVCLFAILNSGVPKASSPNPDIVIGLFQIVIFVIFLNIIRSERSMKLSRSKVNDNHYQLVPLIILCVTAVTIKLSLAVFCCSVLALVARQVFYGNQTGGFSGFRLGLVCVVIFAVHALRGIALSGFPFYPSTFAGFRSLFYAPDISVPIQEAQWIYSWARQPEILPHIVLKNWDWLASWTVGQPLTFWLLVASAISLLIVNLLALASTRRSRSDGIEYSIWIPFVATILFWFFTAPDPRFLGWTLELSIVVGGWLALRQLSINKRLILFSSLIIVTATACILLYATIDRLGPVTSFVETKHLDLTRSLRHIILIDIHHIALAIGVILIIKYTSEKSINRNELTTPTYFANNTRKVFAYLFKITLVAVTGSFLFISVAHYFKIETGLGSGQYFFVRNFVLSFSGMNSYDIIFIVCLGVIISAWAWATKQRAIQPSEQRTILVFTRKFCFVLVGAYLAIQMLVDNKLIRIGGFRGWPSIPTEPYNSIVLESGLSVNVPEAGYRCWISDEILTWAPLPCAKHVPASAWQCWETPLPCTHSLNPNLVHTNKQILRFLPYLRVFTLQRK
jgi:hypothetical protein